MLEKYFGKSSGEDLEEGTKNKKGPASSSCDTLYGALFAGLSTVGAACTAVEILTMPYPNNIFAGIVGIPASVMAGAIGISLLTDGFRERRKEKNAQYNMHD
jgi:hypothetical protein